MTSVRNLRIWWSFIQSNLPDKLSQWYLETLGVPQNENCVGEFRWTERNSNKDSFSIFHVYKPDDAYFKSSASPYMINFKVKNLDYTLSRLKAAGVKVYPKFEEEFMEDLVGLKIRTGIRLSFENRSKSKS